jgi:hypothetical protein
MAENMCATWGYVSLEFVRHIFAMKQMLALSKNKGILSEYLLARLAVVALAEIIRKLVHNHRPAST